MKKRKILFLGESYRADAITWMNGLKEFGDFEIVTWELKSSSKSFIRRAFRFLEFYWALFQIKKIVKKHNPDMVIAERTTSYGFLATFPGGYPTAIAQQGKTDLWPENSVSMPLKKMLQNFAFKRASLIHAWGPIMAAHMKRVNVDMSKVMVLPKGINLNHFQYKKTSASTNPSKITAIVTRSLLPEYRHEVILEAFSILDTKKIDFELIIVGDGNQADNLKQQAIKLNIHPKVNFTGRINNTQLPELLQQADFYISMPTTEGVSASLFEAMASGCHPLVSNIEGNQSWIRHGENGQLINVDDAQMLASELIWAFENESFRKNAVQNNRKFIEEKANYSINMKIIADKYHQLIDVFESKN